MWGIQEDSVYRLPYCTGSFFCPPRTVFFGRFGAVIDKSGHVSLYLLQDKGTAEVPTRKQEQGKLNGVHVRTRLGVDTHPGPLRMVEKTPEFLVLSGPQNSLQTP